MPWKPPGTGRARASSVIAIATTASEKKTTRSAALASTWGSSVPAPPTGALLTGGTAEVPAGWPSCDSSDGAITTATPGRRRTPRRCGEEIGCYIVAGTRSLRGEQGAHQDTPADMAGRRHGGSGRRHGLVRVRLRARRPGRGPVLAVDPAAGREAPDPGTDR